MAANQYDAIIIGGGHNGLVAAAYLARAGKKVVVLERRHIVGGAAVTEEIFPGYKFTEFSYVVSLLRPEIIRDLELPRHGLKILPLPSTFTPMDNGDYLAAWDDHDLTRREIYRHSPKDAEAYDEYARVMARAAKAIKPIINLMPPDPSSLSAARPARPAQGRPIRDEPVRKRAVHDRQARHAIVGGPARRVVRVRCAERHQIRQRHHRHVPRSALARHGVRAAPSLHGRDRRRVPRLGLCQERLRRRQRRDRSTRRKRLGVEIRVNAGVKQVIVKGGRAVGVALENGDELHAKVVMSAADPKRSFLQFVERETFPRRVRHVRSRTSACAARRARSTSR